MAIPSFQDFMLPILKQAAAGPIKASEIIEPLAREFNLTEEEKREMLPSGNQRYLNNRISWAFVYLVKGELLQRNSPGHYAITPKGLQLLSKNPDRIDRKMLAEHSSKYRKFDKRKFPQAAGSFGNNAGLDARDSGTPEERIEEASAELNAALQSDIQDHLQVMDDTAFEQLIVKLMIGLGYGAGGLAKRTGGSGDGGIDGIITEDVLGLDVIYLQAKRYSQEVAIGPDKIREFAGAMDAHGIVKGVFVTTARFTKSALEYATLSHKRLRLIDGGELARLMIQHGIGVREYRRFELKRIDADFFDELEGNS